MPGVAVSARQSCQGAGRGTRERATFLVSAHWRGSEGDLPALLRERTAVASLSALPGREAPGCGWMGLWVDYTVWSLSLCQAVRVEVCGFSFSWESLRPISPPPLGTLLTAPAKTWPQPQGTVWPRRV